MCANDILIEVSVAREQPIDQGRPELGNFSLGVRKILSKQVFLYSCLLHGEPLSG